MVGTVGAYSDIRVYPFFYIVSVVGSVGAYTNTRVYHFLYIAIVRYIQTYTYIHV